MLISAIIAGIYGIMMLISPSMFTASMLTNPTEDMNAAMRFLSAALIALAATNFIARNEPWSKAIQAILIGNAIIHIVGFITDYMAYQSGVVTSQGIMMGAITHIVLGLGALYYAFAAKTQQMVSAH